jgi:putative chitinase
MNLLEKDLIFFGVSKKNASIYLEHLNKYLPQFNIDVKKRFICFMANVLHETMNLHYVEETASGSAYEFRKDLGNTISGYGVKYKGRGLGQLTGYSNYVSFQEFLSHIKEMEGIDVIKNPKELLKPDIAVLSACFFWKINNLEKYSDVDKFYEVCAIWNTGKTKPKKVNGLAERERYYNLLTKWANQ